MVHVARRLEGAISDEEAVNVYGSAVCPRNELDPVLALFHNS